MSISDKQHVQSLSWYRNLAQLYLLERATTKVSSMTRQVAGNEKLVADTILHQVEQKLQGGKR